MDAIDYGKLRAVTADAVRNALTSIRMRRPKAKLVGFALCTDDNAGTVFPMAASQVAAEFAFLPNEWDVSDGAEAFSAVRELLKTRRESGKDGPHEWMKTFRSFVMALDDVQREGHFGIGAERDKLVLMVASTDPSEDMDALQDDWIKELNPPSVYNKLPKPPGGF